VAANAKVLLFSPVDHKNGYDSTTVTARQKVNTDLKSSKFLKFFWLAFSEV
jgi:hypothetical protein